ncbi:MAG: hypothetical protein JNJ85_06765, partial [Candidatus Kapabacteria bacterium]|nr:hypothetical protein [Candidatus Kapabacteria bacterium]
MRKFVAFIVYSLLFYILTNTAFCQYQWKKFGDLIESRQYFNAIYIGNGEVLVIGGYAFPNGLQSGAPTRRCEIINAYTKVISSTDSMRAARAEFIALLTPDSNVIAISGLTNSSGALTNSVEVFNRVTKRWSVIGTLNHPRRQLGATFISNTEILIVGGRRADLSSMDSAEIFNIATGISTDIRNYPLKLNSVIMSQLSNGQIIGFSGRTGGVNSYRTDTMFSYNRNTNQWVYTGKMYVGQTGAHSFSLWNNRVLSTGGSIQESPSQSTGLGMIENNGTWNSLPALQQGRYWHWSSQWNTDSVLVSGGFNNITPLRTVDWINVRTGTSSPGPLHIEPHAWHILVSVPILFDSNFTPRKALILAISGMKSSDSSTRLIEVLDYGCTLIPKIQSNQYSICAGDTMVLDAGQNYMKYNWGNGSQSRYLLARDSGWYKVTVTDSLGCVGKDSVYISIYPQPKAKITGKSFLCIGDSTVLTTLFDSTYTYQWYKGNIKTKISGAVRNSYSSTDSGMYYVQVKNTSGCIVFDSLYVRFNPKPNPKIQQSRPFFCIGDTLVLTVNNNYFQYKWSNGTTGSKTVIKDSGLYVITVVDSLGCIGTDSIRVKGVLPISPTINSSKTILCDNDTAKLEANQGFSAYHWSTGQNTRSIIVRGPGTYYVYAIDINGCTGRDSMVLSYPPPPPGLNLTATKQAICLGDTAVLTVTPGYKSYEWSNGMNASKIAVTEPGNYYVYVRDSNGCRYSLTTYVGNSKFRITGYPKVACIGDVVVLKCPGNYNNFLWSTGERTREIKVTTSGTYKVTVLDLDSKCNSDSVTIEFLPKPQAKILTSRTSFCGGDTIILRRAKGTGAAYWYPIGAEVTDTLLVRATGTYILGVKSSNGCWSYDTVQIKNTPPPTCSITANKQFLCERDSLVLQATSGFKRYKWSSGDTTSFITVTKEGTYYVTVYTDEGCYTTAEYNVYLRLAPNVNITSNKAQICTGDTAILIASADIKDVSYEWSTGEKGSIIKVTSPGVYVVKAIYTNGCSSMARVTLVSNVSKQISITSSHKVICGDNSATLTASQGFKEYLWNTGSTQQSITINESGVYTVEAKDSNNCVSIAQFAIKKVPLPSPLIQSTEQTWCKGDAIA